MIARQHDKPPKQKLLPVYQVLKISECTGDGKYNLDFQCEQAEYLHNMAASYVHMYVYALQNITISI